MAVRKEVHFFDNEAQFADGAPNYAKYHAHFTSTPPQRVLGEATPIYLYWRSAPERIHAYHPGLKHIILLRNPISRAHSHWNMERSRGAEQLSFYDALVSEQERCAEALPLQHRVYSYTDRGFYLQQLERLWALFPPAQVLVLKHEQLLQHPQHTLRKITDFLGVSPFKQVTHQEVHARPYDAPLGAKEKAYLLALFRDEIEALAARLQWDCSDWLAI